MEYIKIPPIQQMDGAFSVKDLNVIVTGGNRGIGAGICKAFAQSGANIAILCRNKAGGDAFAEELEKTYPGRFTCIRCDLSLQEEVDAAVKEIFSFFDNVDVLINNAGDGSPGQFLDTNGLNDFCRLIDINLLGPARLIYGIAPKMIEAKKGGSIINISSAGAITVHSSKELGGAGYSTSKAGLDTFTRHLAVVLGDYGIRVNGINPGPTHTDLDENLPDDFAKMIEEELPAHRFGEALEVGAACVFLASPAAAHFRGINWRQDGGLTLIQ